MRNFCVFVAKHLQPTNIYTFCVCMMCHRRNNNNKPTTIREFFRKHAHTHTQKNTWGHSENCKKKCTCSKCSLCGLFSVVFAVSFSIFFSRSCAPVASRSLSTLCSPHGSCPPPPQPPPRSKRAEDGGEESARHWGKNCVISTFC